MKQIWIWIVLAVSAVWVFYNCVFSGTILYFDSLGYDSLGRMITQGKIADYLAHGPSREPLYPIFIAINMKLAEVVSLSYPQVLLLSQGCILLVAQWMLSRIFDRLKLPVMISAGLLIYFIISPTVLRSALIVYSEILTYPLMLLIVWTGINAWEKMISPAAHRNQHVQQALLFGSCFLPMVFVKGIFEMIAPACIFFFALILFFQSKHQLPKWRIFVFAGLAFAVFIVPVHAYKMLNKICHGQYVFTNRGSWALYGSTARKIMATTSDEDLAQMWYVFPDKGICDARVNPSACGHWFYALSDQIGQDAYKALSDRQLKPAAIDQELNGMSRHLMLQHPIKQLKGMFWEGAKLIFFEYPSWGMVILTREIRQCYEHDNIKRLFLFGVNGASVLLFMMCLWRLFWVRQNEALFYISFGLTMVYLVAHSFFFLNERNALPIVPVLMVLYGCILKYIFSRKAA